MDANEPMLADLRRFFRDRGYTRGWFEIRMPDRWSHVVHVGDEEDDDAFLAELRRLGFRLDVTVESEALIEEIPDGLL